MNNDNLRRVHKTLLDNGYTPPTYEEFENDMQDDNNLRGVYETLKKEGYTPPEYEQFKSDMGFAKVDANPNVNGNGGDNADANPKPNGDADPNLNANPNAKPWEAKVAGVPSLYDIADKQREETPKMPNYRHEVSVDEEGGKISKPVVKWQPDKAERASVEKQMTEMRQNIEQSKEDIDTKNKYIGGLTEKPFDTGMQRIEIGNTESVFQQRNPRVVETSAYNTESGEFEKGYINEAGEYNNKAMAERDQKQIDRSRYIDMHPDYAGRANRNQVANMDRYIDDNLREAQKESAEIIADYIDNASLGALALMEVPKNPMMGGVDTDGFKLENIPTEKAQAAAQRIREFEAASRSMRDAKRIIAEADRAVKEDKYDGWLKRHTLDFAGGVARGFGDKFFDIDTWDFGLTDIKDNSSLLLALDKADKGEELTESQRALLDAKAIELATQAYFGSQVGKGYNAGAVTAESIPFMLEMCINPAASAGTTAASKMARYALKRFAKKAVTEGVEELTERGLMRAAINAGKKNLVKRAALGGRIGGDLVAGAGVTATTGSGRVLADTMDRMAGEVKYDENELGLASYAGRENQKEFGEAFAKAFASGTIENYSEMVGEYFSPILGVAGKYIGKGLDKMKLGFINDAIDNISASKLAKAVNDFESHAKYSGSIGEFSEEIAGGILNSIFVGDQTLDTNEQTGVFNPDNLIDTYLGVSIFGGVMSGVKTFGYRTPKYRAKQNMVEQDKIGSAMFGNQDKWGQIRNTIAVGSEEDIAAVLQEVKNDDSLTQEQKMQAFKYAAYAMNYKGVLMAEQKRREEQPREHTDFETSFDNGYSLEGQEMNDAMNMYDMQRNKAVQVLGEDKVAELDANPVDAMAGIDTEEQLQVATEYVNAKATFDGMGQKVLDDINAQIAESEKNLNELTSKTDGKIHPVTLKGERKAHIVDGNVAVTDNGEIDAANSDLSILVRDDETGKIEFVSPSDIVTSDGAIDAEEEKANVAQAIRDAVTQQADAQMNGILSFNVGDEYDVLDDEGNAHTIAVVDNGQEGQVLVSVDGENVARMMPREEVQKMANNANLARLAAHEAKKETKRQMENGETSGEADNNNVGAHEPLAATPDAMPMIKNSEDPDFMATTPERGHRYLYDEAGIPKAAADNMVTAHINAAEKEVKKQSDALAKLDANPGTSISAYKAKQADIKGKLDAAQAAYDYWNGVKTEQGKRDEAERQAAFVAQTADASGRQNELAAQKTPKEKIDAAKQMYGEYFDSDFTVPYDAMELVAMNMPNEKISWEGREGVRGLQQELGSNFKRGVGRDKGTNAFNIYLAKKGEGISTDEVIHSIYESAENTLPNGEHRWDVEEIRGAFIDMFMGAEKPSDIRDYVLNNRIRQAEQMRAAEDEAAEMARLDDEIMQSTGMEREEYAAWIAELEARADAQAAYENEVYNETNTSNDRETEGSIGEEGSGQVQGQEGDTTGVEEDGAAGVAEGGRNEGTQGDTTERQEGDLAQTEKGDVKKSLQEKVLSWLSEDNVDWAEGKDLGEIEKRFGNKPEPIAIMPAIVRENIESLGDDYLYCGKAYMIDHHANHHPELDVDEYVNIQSILDEYDDIKDLSEGDKTKVAFVKKLDKGYAVVVELSKENDKIMLHKTFFYKDSAGKRTPFKNKPSIKEKWSVDGSTTISPIENQQPADTENISALDQSSASKGTENSETDKETEQKFNKGERFLLASGAEITIEDVDEKGVRTFTWKSINNDNVHTSKATIEELEVMGARPLESVQESVAKAEEETDTNPTEGQKKAGNYKKGHVKIDGYDVSIEQPKGSVRSGVDANGKKWEQTMNNTYGYIRGTEGVDGDHIDVFLSDNLDDWDGMVYVVDQVNNDGSFDEHKVMYGFNSAEEARAAYLSNYKEGWQGLGTMTGVTKEEFKKWVNSSHRKTKPFAEYKSVQKEEGQNESTINGAVDMATMQPVMGEEAFAELLESGDREMMEAYLKEIEHALRLGDNAPLDGQKEVRQDYKKAVEQYGKENIPADVLAELTKRMEPYDNLARVLYDRKYALEDKLRNVDATEQKASAEKKQEEKAAHKQTAYNGFLADKTALGADAAEKALSKRINIEGEVMTVAEFVEKQHQSGSLVPSISEEPKYKGVSKRAWNRMDAAQQAAEEERVKNGGTKSVYRLNGYELGKTAYDYAQYLMKNNNDNVDKAEKAKPKETASIKEVVRNYVDAYRIWADDLKNDAALKAWQNARKELEGRLNELSDEELEGLKSQLGGDFANIADFVGDISRRRTQNRELSNAFDEGMKAQKEISGTAKAPKVVLDNFTANDEQRLVLNGVHHDEDRFAVATNGMILIADRRQYDEANKGKTIISHKVGNSAKKGDIVDFRFPNWKMVVKAHPNGSTASVTFDGLRKFLAGVEEFMKYRWNTEKENGNTKQSFASWSSEANIAIRMPNGEVCVYKYNGLSKFADAAANMGMTDIYYAADRALMASNENGYVLLMPTKPNILTEEESLSYDAGRRFFYEWNSSSADRLHSKPNEQGKTETEKPQKSEKKSSARASSVGKIDDFGEKIGGARKDLARGRIRDIKGYTTKDLTTLKKGADDILSQANILRLYKDGQMDEQTARGFLAMNNAVKVAIKKYGRTAREIILNKYRDAAVAWEEGRAAEFGITDADVAAYMAGFDITEEKARKDLDYCITETFDMYMLTYQAMNYPAVERKLGQYVIVDYGSMRSRRIPLSRPFWVKTSYTSGRGYPFATLEGAMEKLNQLCPEVKPKDTEKKEKGEKAEHGLRVTKEGFGFYVKSRNIPGNIYLSPKFTSEKQAQAYMEENLEQLKAREQRLVDALMGSNIGMAEREGVDYRNGKDVTPQDFLDEFGFRGVEFGNWVPQGERQMYLNKTYDAIKDFCAIVGISPKAFSLGGRLGLAFGARGSGRALAHYEPGKEAINLTRMSGVGSLAHEWFHALDNILAKQETGNTSDMATMRYDVVREEVSAVLKEMYRVMKAMDYDMRSRRAGEYWGRTEEEFARLFENYIYNKLAEKEVTSPILVRKDILFDDAEEVSKNRWPYPSVAENATMAPLFDKLFDTIQEKTDEKGNVVLFQKLDGSTLSKEADATEMMMRDALIETMEGAGIEVVTDVAIGQQVLDENANATREMRVYHGSGADFDAFDHSHMGEGEGAQAYGWGTYVTEVEGIGKTYAQEVSADSDGLKRLKDTIRYEPVLAIDSRSTLNELRKQIAELEEEQKQNPDIDFEIPRLKKYIKEWERFGERQPTLYTVEIPEENAAYYIGYNERMREQQEIVEMADNELAAQGWRRQEIGEQMVFTNNEGKRIVFTPNQTGADFYEEFVVALGSKKAASEFLSSVGITGIKYPAEFRSGGRTDGASNYVIFDESDIEITNKARLFRTSNGEVYGYTMGGKIYLDTRIATTETPIHEYSHLWSEALEQANPKAWEQLKNDLVKDTELMDYVKGLYPEIEDENELMHEVFAHFSGKRGRARLEEMRKEETEKANGLLDKARIIAMFHRLKELLGRYWTMARDLFAGSVKGLDKMKAEDFADMAMADLLGGFNPGAAARNNDIRYQFVGEQGAAEAVKMHYDALAQKYHGKPYRIVMSIDEMADEDFLKEMGKTEEDLSGLTTDEIRENVKEQKEYTKTKKIGGGYNPVTRKIIIFAENIPSLKETEDTFFHENLHGILHELYGDNPQSIALRFWDAAEKWSDKKSIIAEAYRDESEHRQKEEFFVYLLSRAMVKGRVDEVLNVLTEEDAERVENILSILGYDRQTEELDRRREKGKVRENNVRGEGNFGQDVQADRHRRTVDVAEGGKLYRNPLFREGGVLPTYEESLASSKAAGYTKRQHDAWWNRAHKNMRLRANEIAKKLHLEGVVDIYETADDLNGVEGITEEDKKSKGWYDPKTGRIAIILGNHASAYDVMMSMLHEGVAHFGLRQLFGKNFETFLWNVYSNATPEVRNEINKLMAKNGWNYETATEEYLAGLAEDIDFDRVMKSGWWWKIKDWFVKMLRDIGLGSYVPEGKIGDNELRYVLWRSYYNLELGGAYGTLLGSAIDVAKQYELGVGKFAPKEEVLGIAESGIGMSLEETNRRFNDELQRFDEGQMKSNEYLRVGMPNGILGMFVPGKEIILRQKVLTKALKKHGISPLSILDLPSALSAPIFVFKSNPETISVLTELTNEDGKNIFVAIELDVTKQMGHEFVKVNDILTIHGREIENIVEPINDNNSLVWVDKEKGLRLLSSAKTNSQAIANEALSSAAKVVENFVNPKISAENVEKNAEKLHRSGDGTPRAMARDTYERLVMSGTQQFREAVQDSMLSLKNLYKSILKAEGNEKHIKDVAGYENAYLAENRMHSASQAQISAWTQDFFTPIVEEVYRLVGDSKSAYEELNDYLMAKHGLERNIVLAERDARKEYDRLVKAGQPADLNSLIKEYREKDYSGLTALTGENNTADAELLAQQMVDDFEASHDTTKLWARINAATKSSLEKMFRSGLMSKARYEDIRDMFEYYIPLQGFDEKVAEDMYAYVGSDGTRMYGTPIRSARGRRSKADNPLATIAMNGEAAIRQGNRNEMKQHFLNFVQAHPSDVVSVSDVWLRYNDVTDEWEQYFDAGLKDDDSPEEVERKVRDFNERMEQLAASNPDRYKRGRDAEDIPFRVVSMSNASQHQVIVKRGGKTIVLTINGNPRAAQALNGLTNPDVFTEGVFGKAMNLGQNLNRLLSSLYTTRNPEFVASNYTRDALYSNCMTWVKESPAYAVRFHKNFGMANPAFMAKMFVEWENGELRKKVAQMGNTAKQGSVDYMRKQFYDFMMNGGETGWTSLRDIEAHKKDLEASLKKEGSTSRKAWKALGGTLDIANRAVENCARFSAFVTSREMGRSLERSIYDAKEVSVNFNKKGAGDKFLSAKGQTKLGKTGSAIGGLGRGLFVFFNAGVQGMANYMGAAKHNPAKLAVLSSLLFGLGSIIPIVTAIACGGDDDDEDSYYNLPEYVRRSNLCFRWRKDMPWIKIPLPIEFRAMYGLGELSCGVLTGKERYTDEELAKQYISQVSQVLPLDFMEGGGGWHAFVPSSVKPGVEAYTNKGWTGLPIYKDNKFKEYYPQWTRAYESADKTIVEATRWLNEATGGSDVSQGMIDWNPARIEYMLKGYLGGYYTMFDRLKKSAETAFGKREFEWRNVPIASRFVQEGDERTEARKAKSEYFDLHDEYEKTKSDMNGFKKIAESGRDDAQEYAERLSDLENSQRYVHFQIMENYKPILDAYNAMIKEAEGEYKEELKAEEDALRRELIELIHAVDDEKEVNIEEQIKGDLDVLSQSEHKEIKKAVGSVMAKQLGGKYRSSTTEYGKAYEKIRNLEDLAEDLQMQIAIGEAEDSDDVRRKKVLEKARRDINALKKRLGDPDEDDEKTMRDIRKKRRDALKRFEEEE